MTKIGVVKSVDQFYDILYAKYKEYLYRLVSTKKMLEKLNITIETRQDIIDNMENIRKYVRGHNLYDIFYGRYKGEKENAILRAYIDAAPRENFDDIFDAIDNLCTLIIVGMIKLGYGQEGVQPPRYFYIVHILMNCHI